LKRRKRHRSGKELWAIARRLYFQDRKPQREKKLEFVNLIEKIKRNLRKHELEVDKEKDTLTRRGQSTSAQRQEEEEEIAQEEDAQGLSRFRVLRALKKKVLAVYQKLLIHPSNRKL